MEIKEGQIIDGLFRITKKDFKKGAGGSIHLATDPRGRGVVLKFPIQGGITRDLEHFKKEYQNLLKFTHPNVARAWHFGQHEGRFFIASEFVEGEPFRTATIGAAPMKLIPLFIQGLEGLEAIHIEQMLHLDIKSSNVMVTKEGKVKLIDFGMAVVKEDWKRDTVCGSVSYMAPEMVLKKELDNRADCFSFGVLMYYCVTAGKYPFVMRDLAGGDILKLQEIVNKEGPPRAPSHYNPDVPAFLDEIILRMLAKEPENRFGSARAIINTLMNHHPEDYEETPESKGSYLIPRGNRHIGRQREQKLLMESLEELMGGRQPQNAVFWIHGGEGVGKSHLLKTVREKAEQSVEKMSIHSLELPKKEGDFVAEGAEWPEGWIQLLNQRLAENQKPILVLIDNAEQIPPGEFLDNTLLALLERMNERRSRPELFSKTAAVMICLTDGGEKWAFRKYLVAYSSPVEMELKPFSPEELRDYLSATPALRHKKIPESLVEALYNKTEGNPREIAEILKLQDSRGLLFGPDGEILVAQVEDTSIDVIDDTVDIPSATQARLTGALAGFSEAEREILEWMAVWCREGLLDSVILSDLQKLISKNHLLLVFHSLVSKGILIHNAGRDAYRFVEHSYLPELVNKTLEEGERRKRHQGICEYLGEYYGGREEYQDGMLLHKACGDSVRDSLKAILHLGKKKLYKDGKVKLARSLFKHELNRVPPDKSRLYVFMASRLIEASFYAGDYQLAEKTYAGALEVIRGQTLSRTLRIMPVISILPVLLEGQRFEEAQHLIEDTLASCDEAGQSHLRAVLLNFKAHICYKKFYVEKEKTDHLLDEARRIYEESEASEEKLHPHQRNLIRNNDLGIVLHALGENKKAIEKLKSKLERLKHNPNVFTEFVTLTTLAEANRVLKNFNEALRHSDEALATAKETRNGKWIHYAHQEKACIHHSIGLALLLKKKKEEGRRQFLAALNEEACCLAANTCFENRKEAGLNALAVFIRKGQCHEELGEWGAALTHFNAALDCKPQGIYLAVTYLGLAECFLQKGDLGKARGLLEKSRVLIEAAPPFVANTYLFRIQRGFAKSWLKEKNQAKVAECLNTMRRLAETDEELAEEYKNFEEELYETADEKNSF